MTLYRDPQFPTDFIFEANRLLGIKEIEKTLKPREWNDKINGKFQPQIGFTRNIPKANLSSVGHRILNRSLQQTGKNYHQYQQQNYGQVYSKSFNQQTQQNFQQSNNYLQHQQQSNSFYQYQQQNNNLQPYQHYNSYYYQQQLPPSNNYHFQNNNYNRYCSESYNDGNNYQNNRHRNESNNDGNNYQNNQHRSESNNDRINYQNNRDNRNKDYGWRKRSN